MEQTVYLVVLSAFVLAGDIVSEGDVVEVTNAEARDLLGRGKARVATEEDRPQDEPEPDEPAAAPAGKAKK